MFISQDKLALGGTATEKVADCFCEVHGVVLGD